MLRIIAGQHRGRKLLRPDSEISRPTSDRAKEGIFSMIQFQIPGSLVLDLFAGSGSLSLEAISRGAMKAIAIDSSKKATDIMTKNRDAIGIDNMQIRRGDVIQSVAGLKGTKFDFIFMDPPYIEIDLYNKTLEGILTSKLLNTKGLIILETDTPDKIIIPKGLVIQKTKNYGKTSILLIANNI